MPSVPSSRLLGLSFSLSCSLADSLVFYSESSRVQLPASSSIRCPGAAVVVRGLSLVLFPAVFVLTRVKPTRQSQSQPDRRTERPVRSSVRSPIPPGPLPNAMLDVKARHDLDPLFFRSCLSSGTTRPCPFSTPQHRTSSFSSGCALQSVCRLVDIPSSAIVER